MRSPVPCLTQAEQRFIRRRERDVFDSLCRDYAEPVSGAQRGRLLALNMGIAPADRQAWVSSYLKTTDFAHERQMRRLELAQALHAKLFEAADPQTLELRARLMAVEYSDALVWVVDVAPCHGLQPPEDTPGPRPGSGMARHDDILVEALEKLMTKRLPDRDKAAPEPMTAMQALRAVSQFAFGSADSKGKRLQRRRRLSS